MSRRRLFPVIAISGSRGSPHQASRQGSYGCVRRPEDTVDRVPLERHDAILQLVRNVLSRYTDMRACIHGAPSHPTKELYRSIQMETRQTETSY